MYQRLVIQRLSGINGPSPRVSDGVAGQPLKSHMGAVKPRKGSAYLQNQADAELNDLIDRKEEHAGQKDHDEHHRRGNHGFLTRRPGYLPSFGADLLNKLDRTCLRHISPPAR